MNKWKFFVILALILIGLNSTVLANENMQYDALAIMECSKGNNAKALEYINRALEENSQEYRYYNTRASIKEKMEDYNGALQDYDTALSINPEYATAYFNRANLYVSFEKNNEAMNDFCMAIKYAPDYDSYNNRGLLRMNIEDYDGAIYDFTKAIAIDSKPESAYFNRGYVYYLQNQLDKSISDLSVAIKNKSHNPDAYYYRGLSKAILGKKESGLVDLNRAKEQYLEINDTENYQKCIQKINIIKTEYNYRNLLR